MDVKVCHRVFVIEQRNMFDDRQSLTLRSSFFSPIKTTFFIFSFSILFFLMLADQSFSKNRNFYLIHTIKMIFNRIIFLLSKEQNYLEQSNPFIYKNC